MLGKISNSIIKCSIFIFFFVARSKENSRVLSRVISLGNQSLKYFLKKLHSKNNILNKVKTIIHLNNYNIFVLILFYDKTRTREGSWWIFSKQRTLPKHVLTDIVSCSAFYFYVYYAATFCSNYGSLQK